MLYALAEHMGYSLSWDQIDVIASQLFGGTATFRKGQIGEWGTNYSDANRALFKELLGQTTIDLGYATDFNW